MSETGPPEELPPRPSSHRASAELSPVAARVLAPFAAVAVVVLVIVLLLVINGHSSKGPSSAAATTSPSGRPTASGTPTPTHTRSTAPTSPPSSTTTNPTAPTHSHSAAPTAVTATAPVTVLNNSRRTGLAHAVAAEVAGRGWTISSVGNLQGLVAETTVYYAPGTHAAASHLASEFASIQRVEPDSQGGIHLGGLTLVLTASWAG